MNLPSLRRRRPEEDAERDGNVLSIDQYMALVNSFQHQGLTYSYGSSPQEEIGGNLTSMAQTAYKRNGVVFACMLVRMQLFAEARFQFRRIRNGQPGDMFGNADLKPLEKPWVGGTTGDMLSRMIQYADLTGNAFAVRRGTGIVLLRPDWVKIIAGVPDDADASLWRTDAEILGYVYLPGGPGSGEEPEVFLAEEVAHFAPIPDPEARFRGMSWLTPIIREIMADKAATDHKLTYFENGATPNMIVKLATADLEKVSKWIELFKNQHEGVANAYKTVFLGDGADATVVGNDFQQLDFKSTQGAGETRIATAAGVPPVIVGLSEGLQAATYSNYGQARRRFSDGTMWPLWRNAAGSLARIINVPSDAELWVDGRHIPFLREDSKDLAEIKVSQSLAIKQLTEAGFEPDSVVEAITTDDLTRLKHTGMTSVQLLPPGTPKTPDTPAAPAQTGTNSERSDQLMLDVLEASRRGEIIVHNHIPEQRASSVTVEPAEVSVTLEQPAPAEVTVNVEAQEAPKVEFGERAIVVEAAPTPDVTVNVEAQEAPKVEFGERSFVVEPADVSVTVQAPEAPPPAEVTVHVDAPAAPPPAEVNIEFNPELRASLEIDELVADALRQAPEVTVNVEPTPVTIENTVQVDPTPVQVNIADEPPSDASVTFQRNPDGTIKSAKITED